MARGRLPTPVARVLTLLLDRLPQAAPVSVPVRRRLLALAARAVPVPADVRITRTALAGVPAVRVDAPGADPDRALLYLHGGAYTVGSATTHRGLVAGLARTARAPVYLLEYRLAPEHPYPAAVDDATAAYRALVAAGYSPRRLALGGDSCGGGLALAVATRLRDAGEEMPAALALIAPWVDLTCSAPSVGFNARRDVGLSPEWIRRSAELYADGHDLRHSEISPLEADLRGLPPVAIQIGGADLLVSEAERIAERAREAGVEVAYRRFEGMWHDFQLGVGRLAQADAAAEELGAWLRAQWGEREAVAELASRNGTRRRSPTIAIVGGGFGGIGLGMMLTRAGVGSFTIFERGSDVGGVWRDNTYPGAACDVPSHLYSFSFEPHHGWTRRYSPQPEILAYLERCVERYGLADRLRLNTEVTRAEFDSEAGGWRIETSTGESFEADVLVTACGQLSRPATPELPGLERFGGRWFHSAQWDHDFDPAGRRVAVLGTGASAIQFVPEIAPATERLHVFQRSAPYVIPKPDRAYAPWERWLFGHVPAVQSLHRLWIYLYFELMIPLFTRARGGMRILRRLLFERRLRKQVADPALREVLTPHDVMGCKRILISNDWYPALTRPNVDVVTERVTEVTPAGVVTEDGVEREVDAIIFGTGFATTRFLAPMEVVGLGGRDLSDAWGDGAEAYLGASVAGFPNLFILYGPNTNLGAGSIIFQLESQIRYVIDAIRALQASGARYLEVREEVQAAFNREIQDRLADSVWNSGCHNWYVDEAGRNTNNWPGSTIEYRRRTRRLDPREYRLVRDA